MREDLKRTSGQRKRSLPAVMTWPSKLVVLLDLGGLAGLLHLVVEVEGDVGELLLDVAHDLTLGGGGEGVSTLGEDLHHVVGQVAAGQVQTEDGVGKRCRPRGRN